MSKHGTVHWTELMTRDVTGTKAFYEAMCGWTFSEMPMPTGMYYLGMRDGVPVAGLFDVSGSDFEGYEPQWMTYFAVDDIDAALEQTRDAGGKIAREVFEIPGVGRIAMITDPGGAELGIMTPAETA